MAAHKNAAIRVPATIAAPGRSLPNRVRRVLRQSLIGRRYLLSVQTAFLPSSAHPLHVRPKVKHILKVPVLKADGLKAPVLTVPDVSNAVDQSLITPVLIKQVPKALPSKNAASEQTANAVRALKAIADLPATKSAANIAVLKGGQTTVQATAGHKTLARRGHSLLARTMAHHVQTAAATDPAITIAVHTTARRRATIVIPPTAGIRSPTTGIAQSVRVMPVPKVKAHVLKASALKAHVRTDHVRMRPAQTHRVRTGQITKAASHVVRVKPATGKAMEIRADAAAVINLAATLPVPAAVPTRAPTGMVRSHLNS